MDIRDKIVMGVVILVSTALIGYIGLAIIVKHDFVSPTMLVISLAIGIIISNITGQN